jgi:hypothetical protein
MMGNGYKRDVNALNNAYIQSHTTHQETPLQNVGANH